MRAGPRSLALLAALAAVGEAAVRITTHRRKDALNPVAHDRLKYGVSSATRKARRQDDDTVTTDLFNHLTLYYINVTLGTPAQDFLLHIDTGSSDLWVNTASSNFCQRNSRDCASTGTYSSADSSTYKFVNNAFNVTYADASAARGPYVTDTLTVGDATLQDFQFGIGETSNSAEAILGVGYTTNEGAVSTSTSLIYPNLPVALFNAGQTETVAYSLWLNDLDADEGTILFGGVDTNKFQDPLVTLPIIRVFQRYSQFLVALTGVGLNGDSGSLVSNQALPALLDSGTSLSYLPSGVASAIFQSYGAQYDSSMGLAVVDCDVADQGGSIDFTFSGLTISVAIDEMVLNILGSRSSCAFGIAPSSAIGGLTVLGDTFLRSAYVVYDISNNEISMAQTTFNSTSDNVEDITSGTAGVPGATPASVTVTAINTGIIGGVGPAQTASRSNAAGPVVTPAPLWRYGSGMAAAGGAVALALL